MHSPPPSITSLRRSFGIAALTLSLLSIPSLGQAAESATTTQGLKDGLYAEVTTPRGVILLELFYKRTPMTVTNFAKLIENGFYEGLTFHRVIADFMIQGGCPQGTGRGGPGYKFPDEFHTDLRHDSKGVLSMANAGPGTNGSQFFITHKATPHLDNRHSVFGKAVRGLDVIDAVQRGDTMSIKLLRIGDEAKAFAATQAAFDDLVNGRLERIVKAKHPNAKTTESGLWYVITQKGQGSKPTAGTEVSAHYSGRLLSGKEFDSSRQRGPLSFAVGTGRVIKAWDETLLDMQKGEKRTIYVPPELGYGARGGGPIPPNATLIFDIELVDFKSN